MDRNLRDSVEIDELRDEDLEACWALWRSGLLEEALGPCVVAVHHIGGTAVPGLPAQSTLDILVEVEGLDAVDALGASVERQGYRAMGEHGIRGRRGYAFSSFRASSRIRAT